MSAVLKHVVKARPNWRIDYQAEEGRHCVGRGIVSKTFAYGTPYPSSRYDAEVQILLYDTFCNWSDRPNTRVSSCLHERFGIPWDEECGRYRVDVSPDTQSVVSGFLAPMLDRNRKRKLVAVHYQGDSSPTKKNLTHEQAAAVCRAVEGCGHMALLLDWRNASPLPRELEIYTTGRSPFAKEWGRCAEANCAVISQCAAFVGIDSGPSKCASATETPTLVTWVKHHPAPFHDPAPNTTHLVPVGYNGLEPVCNDVGVIKWFEAHHRVRQYERDPVVEIKRWLQGVLA